jgi:hypothetical protein
MGNAERGHAREELEDPGADARSHENLHRTCGPAAMSLYSTASPSPAAERTITISTESIAQVAHLMRRAGTGATRAEIEVFAARPYEEVVEDLLHPDRFPEVDDDLLGRYFPAFATPETPYLWAGRWIYRMANTKRPLQEKMALFWHHVFATAYFKAEHGPSIEAQIDMLRREGLGNFRTLLIELSKDPAMIFWLDNCENHADAPNENFGRELLELFSMGIGNYSETDIKNAAHAFTGWSFTQPIPVYPYGGFDAKFIYRPDDHDDSEKVFLDARGPLNGEDIIDEIVRQDGSAGFIARHLYNFFVADEPQVSAWSVTEPQDPEAIAILVRAFRDSDADMRQVMRVLLNADFFKAARFKRVKCPAEFIAGAYKLSGELNDEPPEDLHGILRQMEAMGQKLLDPPSVEGWHTGKEWIDGGTLMERVNFAVKRVSDPISPGLLTITERLTQHAPLQPAEFVDALLDIVGPLEVSGGTRAALITAAEAGGPVHANGNGSQDTAAQRVSDMLSLIVAAPEYQFA